VWGVILVKVSLEKEYSIKLKIGLEGIYFKYCERIKQGWPFFISSKVG
jgi:hypothetical protein